MGKHSSKKGRGKNRRIVAAGVLIFAVAAAIALGSIGLKPTNDTAGGGGGNTGNSVTVD
jgi:hypothetical protein